MVTITKEQAQDRFATLPPTLQDAIFSVENTDVISSLSEQYKISENKIEDISSLVGWVLLGFLHPEDISKEITSATEITPQTAKDITNTLNEKIFTPLKAYIDTAYAPTSKNGTSFIAPNIIQIIPKAIPVPSPVNLSGTGWSKMVPNGPIITPTVLPPLPPRPIQATTGIKVTPPAVAPVMLRQETPMSASQKNADFHIAKSNEGAQMEFDKSKEQVKVMPAVIEFNKNISTSPKQTAAIPIPIPNGIRPSLSSTPISNSGNRTITEITSNQNPISTPVPISVPKPATIAAIPVPPKPPTPSTVAMPLAAPITAKTSTPASTNTTTQKVIVQDFLQQPQ